MSIFNQEVEDFNLGQAKEAGGRLSDYIKQSTTVGELLSLDYGEATALVHDEMREKAGGLPMGCFLIATRIDPSTTPLPEKEYTALILLRVIGSSPLPNRRYTDSWRFDRRIAGPRAVSCRLHSSLPVLCHRPGPGKSQSTGRAASRATVSARISQE